MIVTGDKVHSDGADSGEPLVLLVAPEGIFFIQIHTLEESATGGEGRGGEVKGYAWTGSFRDRWVIEW